MTFNRFYLSALIAVILILGFLSYQIIKPFLSPIAWAIVLAIVFYPVYAFTEKRLRWKSLASLITLGIILVIILGPFSYLFYLLVSEVASLATHIESSRLEALQDVLRNPVIKPVIDQVLSLLNMTEEELFKKIIDNASYLGKEILGRITKGVSEIVTLSVNFVFMVFALFFFLRDGPELLTKVRQFVPFSEEQKDRLRRQIRDIVVSTVYGGVAVAIVQGIIAGVAFYYLDISTPALWGMATSIASFVPLVGASIVWIPVTGYLFISGALWKGFVLALVGVFGISLVDNILRPLIIRGKMKMPVLVIFFSILGGIKLFGLLGIIMGPLVLALFVSVIEIFRSVEGGQRA